MAEYTERDVSKEGRRPVAPAPAEGTAASVFARLCDSVARDAGSTVPDDQWDGQHQKGMVAGARRCAKAIREAVPAGPKIITLCGSTRFIEHFAIMAWELEKGGAIVLGLHYLPPDYQTKVADHLAEAEGVAAHFDALHLKKIDMSDDVLVLNVCGYIGESTTREVRYALAQGKPVRWLVPSEVPAEFGGTLTEPVVPPERHKHGDLHAECLEWCQDLKCPDRRPK